MFQQGTELIQTVKNVYGQGIVKPTRGPGELRLERIVRCVLLRY